MSSEAKPLTWDSELDETETKAASELLPAGEYNFRVTAFTRSYYQAKQGGKLPNCPMAVMEFDILDDDGRVLKTIKKHNLFLVLDKDDKGADGIQLRILKSFFASIGLRRKGEKLKMDWNKTLGLVGRCKLRIEDYLKDGEKKQANKVHYFIEPSETTTAIAAKTDANDEQPF